MANDKNVLEQFCTSVIHSESVVIPREVAMELAIAFIELKELKKILRDYDDGKRVEWNHIVYGDQHGKEKS